MERGLIERKTETAAVSLPIAIPRSTQRLAVGPLKQPAIAATMAMVQTSFVSPPTSPPDDCELAYHHLMWRADTLTGDAPVGTPLRLPPAGPKTPCGCNDCSTIENDCGELVCMNCGVVCGRIHV